MTQRTHDLAAVTFVAYRFLAYPPGPLNWETIVGIGIGAVLGGLTPDIDNVASKAWKHNLVIWDDDMTRDFFKGHRNWSHSIIGLLAFAWVVGLLLSFVKIPHLETGLVQQAFTLGYLSHLFADSLTHDGVPWFYPIDIHLGFPPFKFLRMKTGGWIEKIVVFPLLLVFIVWIYYNYRENLEIIFGGIS